MTDQRDVLTLLDAYFAEGCQQSFWPLEPAGLAAGRAILEAEPERRIAIVIALLNYPLPANTSPDFISMSTYYYRLLNSLCLQQLPYTPDDIRLILDALITTSSFSNPHYALSFLSAFSTSLRDPQTLLLCRPELERLDAATDSWYPSSLSRKLRKLLRDILDGQRERLNPLRHDEWATHLFNSLEEMKEETRSPWLALLRHCAQAKGNAPTAKWLAQTPRLIESIGVETFPRLALEWIDAFGRKKGARLDEENAELLKGLIWCCLGKGDERLAASLADAAIEGYRKLSGLGPRAPKIGGASVYVLKQMPGLHGAARLERVRLNVKQPSFLKSIEQALDEAARLAGMSRADLEELTVPTFDLEQGRRRLSIGRAVAELTLTGLTINIQWFDEAGKPRKSEPAEVKRSYKAELKEVKRLCNDITALLVAQRDRLERLPLTERQWPLPLWRERYLDHPLVGSLSKRLLWRFTDGERIRDGIWHEDRFVDAYGHPLDLSETTLVSAWHPVMCPAALVLKWRQWLEQHQITQPFKQAHREIYLLTDAERNTATYSNRFAAHILRQHQFHALATVRGWRNQLRLMVDDGYSPATLELPYWGIRAEFWIEGAGDAYGIDTNETGTYLHVATDQVRFRKREAVTNLAHASGGGYQSRAGRDSSSDDAPLPLEQIPPLVLSEVMRDVDLFVGVASVGNDPTWQDGGPAGRYQDYWRDYSFGELSVAAQTRQQVLSRLVPRLTIADRCTLEGRFLRVRGDLRTYRIHLGSSNILMEPNDQYLCIVRGSSNNESATGNLRLPFEGDTTLSTILSKAFLLAEDSLITDPTITRQIGNISFNTP